ncbi:MULTISPECIES: polysaccharide biosynthesis/export family protein [Roseobacteraceae]|uniref:Polysaccharide biosynthesis/export protein n=1 Tax=Pseudosulfitobacter pseudonitzschiae TaxID=1402135 RepID=A0A221K6P1_9RHOB|nr:MULTISPECIES: polysaccharide biosynthesis/export family protein [Roseobacteraceae]ASM74646.1 polysaccharide biosynthesis/export protein [Pseudosulfitobacter pseudonitzschiae]
MFRRVIAIAGLTVLANCGVAYISPKVSGADDKVRIISLDAQSVLAANRSSYNPKQLPAVFFQNVGTPNVGSGAGTVPVPSTSPQTPPGALALRVPASPPRLPYDIGIGDVLLLATRLGGSTVEELSGLLAAQNRRQGYTVQDDGAIAIPEVGRVAVAGLTLEEAEATLFQRLLENQIDPTFSLEIAEFNSKRVSIGGAVGSPTIAPITLTPLTLDQAIAAAGGIQTADLDYASIRIYRDGVLYQIPLTEYLRQGDLQKIRLVANDSVFVDTEYQLDRAQEYFAEQITISQFRQQSRAIALNELQTEVNMRRAALGDVRANYQARVELDAVGRDYAYLSGEVSKPGRFTLPFGRQATLADALYSEGGFDTKTANPSQIYILRGSADPRDFGAVTAWHLDARNASNLTLSTRMELRPNDIIFIAEQPITRWNRVITQITPSLFNSVASAVN